MDPASSDRLRRNLKAATDEALTALANRGLVRRAAKDLQQSESFRVEETAEAVLVHGDGWTVRMPAEGPVAATDNTPASGVTRQIIAATMYLRDYWPADDSGDVDTGSPTPVAVQNESSIDETDAALQQRSSQAAKLLIDASTAALFKWAGKTPVLEASAGFATVGDFKVADTPQLKVEFVEPGIQVVLMTDEPARTLKRLLNQFKSTAPSDQHHRWVMMAVLALRKTAGRDTAITNIAASITDAIREDRRRIALRTQRLLAAVAAAGVAHPSTRTVERLRTSGVAAEAARFPRLALILKSIADDLQLVIDRHAAADSSRMIRRIVSAHSLAEAAAQPENAGRVDLFGRSRSSYTNVGELELSGLGAYGWRTASGYEGVTVVFRDVAGDRFLTAAAARGEGQDRLFSTQNAYWSGIGWSGATTIADICRQRIKLSNAAINDVGRISVSENCRMETIESTDPNMVEFGDRLVSDWSRLSEIAQASQSIGLKRPDPQAAMLVLKPTKWGDRWFDELNQAFVWQIHDEAGAVVHVRVPWSEVDEPSVGFLEAIKVDRDHPTMILGRLNISNGVADIYPFSIFSSGTTRGDKILCPQFDQDRVRSRNEALLNRLRKKFKRVPRVQTRIGDEEQPDDAQPEDDLSQLPLAIRHLLTEVNEILHAALESGSARLSPVTLATLERSRDQLQSLGVTPLVSALSQLMDSQTSNSADILRAAYRLQLFPQVATADCI